jgi:hypothetical protein
MVFGIPNKFSWQIHFTPQIALRAVFNAKLLEAL